MYTSSTGDGQHHRTELTNIRGIGVHRKQWLNAVGIDTIEDLAQTSADELEHRLKNNGRLLPRHELEEWITEARILNQQTQPNQQNPSAQAAENASTSLTPAVELADSSAWTSVAVFKVEYQTRQAADKIEQRTIIHHRETDATEQWLDFNPQLIQTWMSERLQAKLVDSPLEPTAASAEIVPEITRLQIIPFYQTGQLLIADHSYPLFSGVISNSEPFALGVSIQLIGSADLSFAKLIPCSIECTIHDVSTGLNTTLGKITASIPPTHEVSHETVLPELRVSQPGIYRLKVTVTLETAQGVPMPAASGSFKVPMLQVV